MFWPESDAVPGAEEAIRLGYWAAFFVAMFTTAVSLLGVLGGTAAGLFDAGLFAVLGFGIWRKWRVAAVLAFLLYSANIIYSLSQGAGIGILAIFIFVGLVNGLRGTFAYARLSRRSPEAG